MIISDEQARAAAAYLKVHQETPSPTRGCLVSTEIIERARAAASQAPELRADRVAEAKARLGTGPVDSHEVAEKMLSRIVSDALR